MAESNVPLHKWLLACFLLTTNLKGVSSHKLASDIGVTQKTAWFLAHRIRKVHEDQSEAKLLSPVEVDETYMGGRYKNMHDSKRPRLVGAGTQDKTAIVGLRSRPSNKVKAKITSPVSSITLQNMVTKTVEEGSTVYTDQHRGYKGLSKKNYKHESVNHSIGEYIRDKAHTNGVESFWSMLKRGYVGVYHQMSEKHLQRYVDEYVGRHNGRKSEIDTMKQISCVVKGMLDKRLTYKGLVS